MKKAVSYLLFTIFFSWLLLSGIYYFYQSGYNKYHFHETEQLKEIIRGHEKFDIVFLGSSRVKRHVNPCIIDSLTGRSSYNIGLLGANLYEMDLALKCFLKNHPAPAMLVIELPNPAFEVSKAPIYNPNLYFQDLDNNYVFDALRPDQHVYLYKWLPFTRLAESSELLRLHAVFGLAGKKAETDLIHCKGFMSYSDDSVQLPLKRVYPTQNAKIESKGIELLRGILRTCIASSIRPIVVYTPVYKRNDEPMNPKFFSTIERLCKEAKVEFWNYRMADPFAHDHTLFHDEVHLNKKGSELFSQLIGLHIQQTLQFPTGK